LAKISSAEHSAAWQAPVACRRRREKTFIPAAIAGFDDELPGTAWRAIAATA
jgi:hypothetical protein